MSTPCPRSRSRPKGLQLPDDAQWLCIREDLSLSLRELEVVRHIFEGRTLSEVASAMRLALGTVKTYSQRVYRKLGVSNQRELILAVLNVHADLAMYSLSPVSSHSRFTESVRDMENGLVQTSRLGLAISSCRPQ